MNLSEGLAREIARVTEIKDQYEFVGGLPGVNVDLALKLVIKPALERGKKAVGVDDAVEQLAAFKNLQEITG